MSHLIKGVCFCDIPVDLTPEEKAQQVAKAIRKQTAEVGERWERLMGHIGTWEEQVERALDKLQDIQSSMDQLDLRLTQAEELRTGWQPVGDLLIDSLQDHIDKTTVRVLPSNCSFFFFNAVSSVSWLNLYLIVNVKSISRDTKIIFLLRFVLQAFREEIAPLKQDVRAVNDLAGQLAPLDVQLSSTSNRQLDNLNMRWKLLQVSTYSKPSLCFSSLFVSSPV